MAARPEDRSAVVAARFAVVASVAMMGQQVAGRAASNALFLSHFPTGTSVKEVHAESRSVCPPPPVACPDVNNYCTLACAHAPLSFIPRTCPMPMCMCAQPPLVCDPVSSTIAPANAITMPAFPATVCASGEASGACSYFTAELDVAQYVASAGPGAFYLLAANDPNHGSCTTKDSLTTQSDCDGFKDHVIAQKEAADGSFAPYLERTQTAHWQNDACVLDAPTGSPAYRFMLPRAEKAAGDVYRVAVRASTGDRELPVSVVAAQFLGQ